MKVQTLLLETGPLQENCYLLWPAGAREVLIFDAGDDADVILRTLRDKKLTPAAFLQTHCHGDHIGALGALKAQYPAAPLYVHPAEAKWLGDPVLNLSYFAGAAAKAPAADRFVEDGGEIALAGLRLKAIHVPGHSPGGTAYFLAAVAPDLPHLFCGDILFAGSIGRVDLPGGESEEVLVSNIRSKLFVLPAETIVHPGHGPETTIGQEKETNPYCKNATN